MKAVITKVDLFPGKKDPNKRWCKISYLQPDGSTGNAIFEAPEETPEAVEGLWKVVAQHAVDLEIVPNQDGRTFRIAGITPAE